MKYTGLLLFLLLVINTLQGQVLNGSIKDSKGNAIPFSTIFVREVSLGAAANQDGNFELTLPTGIYTCVFQSLGYQQVTKEVNLTTSNVTLHIVLPNMIYNLSEVVITGRREDPAYRIMRNVIARAPGYSRMVKSFNADVYIKGSMHIEKISKVVKWMAKSDLKEANIKEGDTYIEESVNEIVFTAPNHTKQKVKSIQSNFPDFGEDRSSFALGFIAGNIYQARSFGNAFSPLAPGAFNYYRFRYEGRTNNATHSVHKITILPKGKGPQYVKGTIYIVDGLWCISNLDVTIEEQLGVTVKLTQNYNEVKEGAWLPVSNRLLVNVDLMGNRGSFNYHTSIKYNQLVVNVEEFKKPEVKKEPNLSPKALAHKEKTIEQIAKKQEKVDKLANIEDPNTAEAYRLARLQRKQQELRLKDSLRFDHEYVETYKTDFDSSARKHDSTFWNSIRPIPLTGNELNSIKSTDSMTFRKKAGDSLVIAPKSGWPGKLVLGGLLVSDSLTTLRFKGLVNPFSIGFNVVDGFTYSTAGYWERKIGTGKTIGLQPMAGYAFSREIVYWDVLGFYKSLVKNTMTGFRVGQQTFDFNPDGIHPLESTIEGLIFRENPARFYEARYINLHYNTDISNGFSFNVALMLSDNHTLNNSSNYSFFFRNSKEYKANIPDNNRFNMKDHQDLAVEIGLKYKAMPYYYIKDGIKVPRRGLNNSPLFSLSWKKGIPSGIFDTDYDLIKAGMSQRKSLGLYNELNYKIEAGYFINSKEMTFAQFHHFAKRPLVAGFKDFFPYFLLLSSYNFSTDQHFLVGHLHYKSPFIILKRLPVIKNRLWRESLYFSYLYTPQNKNYTESGYSIGNMIFNLGVFTGFTGFDYMQTGVRLSILIFGTKEVTF